MTNRIALIAAAAALLIPLPGCSSRATSATVTGEVTLDGQPLKEGRILLTPLDQKGQTGGGEIKDGQFSLESPLANMKVEINANKVIGKKKVYDTPNSPVVDQVVELIPPRYNVNSELTLEVKKGAPPAKFELKSK